MHKFFYLALIMLLVSCNPSEKIKKENMQLKAEKEKLTKEIADLKKPARSRTDNSDNKYDMLFYDYDPPSTLVVPENKVYKAKFPFIDVHNHQWRVHTQDLKNTAESMDSLNMKVMVNLSGRGFRRSSKGIAHNGNEFMKKSIDRIEENIPGRMLTFTNIDFEKIGEKDWTEEAVRQLEADVKIGAKGLKIFKNLGLTLKDSEGNRVAANDPRLDPIWEKCGELGIPVLIHIGEPAAFWMPIDENNERWLELKMFPNRYRDPSVFPSWEVVMAEQQDVFRKHSNTTFINAHMGWLANDLKSLGKLLDEIPNMYVEIAAVIGEIGRQPRFAKEWLTKYKDRVMFGKDTWRTNEYYLYFRVLESKDDYFKYYRRRHAFWRMYGLGLSDDVLKHIYYKNALKVIPGIDKSLFPKD